MAKNQIPCPKLYYYTKTPKLQGYNECIIIEDIQPSKTLSDKIKKLLKDDEHNKLDLIIKSTNEIVYKMLELDLVDQDFSVVNMLINNQNKIYKIDSELINANFFYKKKSIITMLSKHLTMLSYALQPNEELTVKYSKEISDRLKLSKKQKQLIYKEININLRKQYQNTGYQSNYKLDW